MIGRALRWLFDGRTASVSSAERDAVKAVLPDASADVLEVVVRAARKGDAKGLQAELVSAGVPLSEAPPLAFELRRRFSFDGARGPRQILGST